jgi:hypothetical protein
MVGTILWLWFTPKQGVPDVEKSRIASRYAAVFPRVGRTLATVSREMEDMIGAHRTREREPLQRIGATVQRAAIVEARLQALPSMT